MKISNIKHILIHCTFNIGDVILTLPLAGILKEHYPNVKISFLGYQYTRDIAEQSSYVDAFYSWDEIVLMKKEEAIAYIQSLAFDVVIHESPNKTIAKLMKEAGIRYRIGTSHRLYHWLTCNQWVRLSRKKSQTHESQTNLKLLKPFGIEANDELRYLHDRMGLKSAQPLPPHLQSILKPNVFHLIVHPFSNKHAREWPPSHFNALIKQLPQDKIQVIVTGSKKESAEIREKITVDCSDVTDISGQLTLAELIQLIAHVDGLVTNATGPLHIAAAYNIHALGLYPVLILNRWAPIGKKAEYITSDPHCDAPMCRGKYDCYCMESITVAQVEQKILAWL